jgi:hypothetical protein
MLLLLWRGEYAPGGDGVGPNAGVVLLCLWQLHSCVRANVPVLLLGYLQGLENQYGLKNSSPWYDQSKTALNLNFEFEKMKIGKPVSITSLSIGTTGKPVSKPVNWSTCTCSKKTVIEVCFGFFLNILDFTCVQVISMT